MNAISYLINILPFKDFNFFNAPYFYMPKFCISILSYFHTLIFPFFYFFILLFCMLLFFILLYFHTFIFSCFYIFMLLYFIFLYFHVFILSSLNPLFSCTISSSFSLPDNIIIYIISEFCSFRFPLFCKLIVSHSLFYISKTFITCGKFF